MTLTSELLSLFLQTRASSESICKPLETEDYVVQPIIDVSPPKWHLGHTTWFFEEFLLVPFLKNYKRHDEQYAYVFNSYYESMGARVVRTDRGNLSRPSVQEVYDYRAYINHHMELLITENFTDELIPILEIGIHHEKQHQELLITDIKYILGNNPLQPVYGLLPDEVYIEDIPDNNWQSFEAGIYEIGHSGNQFCYDNELPRHRVFAEPFEISKTLVTNREWLAFMSAGGYSDVSLWHTEGWDWVQKNNICAPQYWFKLDTKWSNYSLNGVATIQPDAVVTHISYYEAFAFALWKGMRLPTEFEWEIANQSFDWSKRWEWTESAYLPYPNYQKPDGALGEYNGKFMVNQKVLRGASVATPSHHARSTYRNFFHPYLRWQFTGLRLAKSI